MPGPVFFVRLLKVLKNNLQRLRRQIVWSMGLEVRYLCILSAILPAVQSWANYYLGSLSARLPICKMRIITSHWIVGLNELMHVKCLVHCKYLIYFSYYDSEKNTGNFTFMSLITFVWIYIFCSSLVGLMNFLNLKPIQWNLTFICPEITSFQPWLWAPHCIILKDLMHQSFSNPSAPEPSIVPF